MKKIVSMMMAALLMVSCLSVNAFAAETKVEVTGETSKVVTATYDAKADLDVYKVDVTWGGLSFTYTSAQREWDATAHEWKTKTEGKWDLAEESTADIKIENHSSKAVDAAFIFTNANGADQVTGSFKKDNADLTNNTVKIAAATKEDGAGTATVTFVPGGSISENMNTDNGIGTITVSFK